MRKNYFYLVLTIVCSINVMAQNIPSYVPKDGLVGFWPFNGNANDESGNGNHGTVNGATLTADRNGKVNSAYSFDGVSNDILIKHNSKLNSYPMTINLWLKSDGDSDGGILLTKYCCSNWQGWDIQVSRANNDTATFTREYLRGSCLGLYEWYCGAQQQQQLTAFDEKWHMYTFRIDSYGATIFWEGIEVGKQAWIGTAGNISNLLDLCIGSYYSKSYFYTGQLDDITIYNRALSKQEIAQLYAGCSKETATSSSFNSYVFTNNISVNLNANPTGGTFSGEAVVSNSFNPSKAKLGKNTVKYNFKNTTGCADSTNFTMILVDTLGNKCSTYDTLKIKVKLTTGIKAGQQTSMNVYPNPTSDKLIIETNDIQALSGYSYKIVDLQGKEVYNALATSAKTEISLKSMGAKGMYILHIVDEKGVSIENKKIVLE